MSIIESWPWRTTAPLTIAREIIAQVVKRGTTLFVFLVRGRVELRDALATDDVGNWLFTAGPRTTGPEALTLLMEGAAMDARELIGGVHVRRHKDGPLYARIERLLLDGSMMAEEIATKLQASEQNVRANLTILLKRNAIYRTPDRGITASGRPSRKYALVGQAEAA